MRVLFDGQIFELQKFGGISRYFTELINGINSYSAHQAICPIIYSENIHYSEKINPKIPILDQLNMMLELRFNIEKRKRYCTRKNGKGITKSLQSQNFDVFVPTYYGTDFLSDLRDKPFVLNVYDMIHEIFPSHLSSEDHIAIQKAKLIEKATKIIAISQSTKNDILKFHPKTDASKIDVVYLSHSLDNSEILELGLPANYILFVGNRGGYKNFAFFLNAIASLLLDTQGLFLVCAGGNAFNEDEGEMIKNLGLDEKVIQINFKDFELATYYKKAKCFVFPSAYEGFGIPVLEAMSCGCPVVLAAHSSFPEVAEDAGLYFELDNAEDLNQKVRALLEDENLRTHYSKKGIVQASKFSWEKTVADCVKVFKSALKS